MHRALKRAAGLCLIISGLFITLKAQDQPPGYEMDAIRSVERMLNSRGDAAIASFIMESMIEMDRAEQNIMSDRLSRIRRESRGLLDDVSIEPAEEGVLMIISNGEEEKHLKIVLDSEEKAISNIRELSAPERMVLHAGNLTETIDRLEKEGMAGVIYIRIRDEVLVKRAFGYAQKEAGLKNNLNTIFGTGSRPIDYTVAAILLLDQEGLINLDDVISKYFDDVPEDKGSMTIRQLLNGQSGLPDFFHTGADWDPDLAWIDRETAVERLLSADLLFEPGAERSHSHAAFGLLAALIEIVSGKTYFEYIRDNFFEPAGMSRTGEYGDNMNLSVSDFAAGGGPMHVGLPNIPPNWGPCSWLIKGSGGMYSNLEDLLLFYAFIRSGKVLDEKHSKFFHQPSVNLDGSDRGFELFSVFMPPDTEIYVFINEAGDREKLRQLFRALEGMVH